MIWRAEEFLERAGNWTRIIRLSV